MEKNWWWWTFTSWASTDKCNWVLHALHLHYVALGLLCLPDPLPNNFLKNLKRPSLLPKDYSDFHPPPIPRNCIGRMEWECNEHYLHSISIYGGGGAISLVAKTHDCFSEKRGEKRKKIFKWTPDTKQHFTFVVVKKKKSHFTDKM